MLRFPFTKAILLACVCMLACSGYTQPVIVQDINRINTPQAALAPLRFLASDELMGRATERLEINIAARYISEEFGSLGLRECEGTNGYFQPFTIKKVVYAKTGTFAAGSMVYNIGEDIVQNGGDNVSLSAPVVYAGFGSQKELDKTDIKGKIVVTDMGSDKASALPDAFRLSRDKQKWVRDRGGLALVERFITGAMPWKDVTGRFMHEHIESISLGNFPSFIINDSTRQLLTALQGKAQSATLTISGTQINAIPAKNVMGWVEGTDPKLKDQFVVLTAHYDHLGVAPKPKMEEGKMDSIYNGARDNAIGVTAVIDAARYFAQHPPKRSVLFIAYAAEEIGELGSQYFAAHPTLPLRQMVYNLNIDNASYNDTTIITVVGLGRTSADDDIKKACAAYGLTALPDPIPEEELFDRSDNTQLAVKGIPAPTFSLGFRSFDETVNKRYHQLSDEVGNLDFNYAMKYINSFVLSAAYIANNPRQPQWVKGDKYEEAWKNLYKK